MAQAIAFNAKLRRTGICGAMETLLLDATFPDSGAVLGALLDGGCELRGDSRACALDPRILPAGTHDWDTEYLDLILAAKTVGSVDEAIGHINQHGSKHSDVIVTEDAPRAEHFLASVDSACCFWNASSRFNDGEEFGFGAEIGISTDKLHARGPMALPELTSYKYLIRGQGQIRG